MSDSNSRRAALHYRLNIQPGAPVPPEVVTLCCLRIRRRLPGVIADSVGTPGESSLRPGLIVPFYMACEALQSALTKAQRTAWLPLGIEGGGRRLRFPADAMGAEAFTRPKVLVGIERQYWARIARTCSSCGNAGQPHAKRLGFSADVLCRECAAPRQLLEGLCRLPRPQWVDPGDAIDNLYVDHAQLPPPWRESLRQWAISSGISPELVTPELYEDWLGALLPTAEAVVMRGKQIYAKDTFETMDHIARRLWNDYQN